MEKKKMGRPTDAPKEHQYRLRMTEKDAEMLATCADNLGISKADVLRKGLTMVYSELASKKQTRS